MFDLTDKHNEICLCFCLYILLETLHLRQVRDHFGTMLQLEREQQPPAGWEGGDGVGVHGRGQPDRSLRRIVYNHPTAPASGILPPRTAIAITCDLREGWKKN